ncbi:MAG: succinate dehydrogenase, cytochrome b556 subunit [Anaerolineales bacterium]
MIHSRWFARERSAGRLAFMLHRLTGLALVLYLSLHLAVLSRLRAGPGAWDSFVHLVSTPLFLSLDVLLLGAVLLHGLNGLRLTLLGLGQGGGWQRKLFWMSLGIGLGLTCLVGSAMFLR